LDGVPLTALPDGLLYYLRLTFNSCPGLEQFTIRMVKTMHDLYEKSIFCPYCGEPIEVLLDPSVPHQNYIEDCQVCCRPIIFDVTVDHENDVAVSVSQESE
jgi:hypothetical protein